MKAIGVSPGSGCPFCDAYLKFGLVDSHTCELMLDAFLDWLAARTETDRTTLDTLRVETLFTLTEAAVGPGDEPNIEEGA